MKKLLALLLTLVFVLSLAIPVLAENGEYNGNGYNNAYNGENGYNNGYYYNDDNGYEYGYEYGKQTPVWEAFDRPVPGYPSHRIFGFIGELTQGECGNYTVEILNNEGDVIRKLWLLPNLRGGTAIVDAVTGQQAELSDHYGGEVLVFYGPVYTHHDIPQSNALVIVINLDATEYGHFPHHHVIEAIEWDEYGEKLKLTVDNGGIIATLCSDTDLQPWLTRQMVLLDSFQVGDEVLLWYAMMGLSFPAHVTPTRAILLLPAAPDWDEIETGYDNGYEYEYGYEYECEEPYYTEEFYLVGSIVRAGINLYRVNLNAEARGYEVLWNNELRRAELISGDTIITIAPGFAVFYINGEAHTMSAPSLLEGGRLFAPVDFFERL